MAVTEPLSILTGGADVGKTTVLKIVIDIVKETGGAVYQMALAGRAAQRMREATGYEAMTIAMFISNVQKGHLNIDPDSLIIIDESSMLDLPIMHRIVRNLPEGVRLLMVGDPYQLPPIGFGLVFHKIVEGSVPRIELTQVHRQAEVTGIPGVALSVRNGVVPHLEPFNGTEMGVSFVDCLPEKIVHLLFNVSKSWDHQTDIQILGVLKSGEAGVRTINDYFHRFISAGKRRIPSWHFAVGDPVIYLENDYERMLFNGTLGRIDDVNADEKELSMSCTFDGVTHILTESDFDKIALAYGITVHKAQGSQFKRVAIPITQSRLLDRTLIYTALTRGIEQVVLIGDRQAFNKAIVSPPSVNLREVGFAV